MRRFVEKNKEPSFSKSIVHGDVFPRSNVTPLQLISDEWCSQGSDRRGINHAKDYLQSWYFLSKTFFETYALSRLEKRWQQRTQTQQNRAENFTEIAR